jgi:nitroimidazol reductase NimA-like FMN-containing flavoprotein (pyridoxamine 5'-phosphate oxidase superfamily)
VGFNPYAKQNLKHFEKVGGIDHPTNGGCALCCGEKTRRRVMVIHEMTKSECLSALARARLGRLACTHGNQPYVVPTYFVYEEPYLYGFTTPGLKVEWMRSNPLVCVELDAVADTEHWTSIIIFGEYEELPGTPEGDQAQLHAREPSRQTPSPAVTNFAVQERLHAHELLHRHAGWWEAGCASPTQRSPEEPVTPIFFRIRIDRITGRRTTPSPGGPVRSRAPSPARDSQGWLRRALRTLSRAFRRPPS